jgi:hypothetical protein
VLKLLDLFSGIGGFSLGLERTGGFETVAFCEIDKFCQKVLMKHWPHVRQYTDIKTLTAAQLTADGLTVDVICGGFPCQDISLAGGGQEWAKAHAADYGASTPVLLANYDHATSSWKTSQHFLGEGLTVFSETWPRSGTMQSGIAYQLPALVRLTDETGFGLWLTPKASDTEKGGQLSLSNQVKHQYLWPTPTSRDYKSSMKLETVDKRQAASSRGVNLSEHIQKVERNNGALNPTWVEWLMGFPLGWTDLNLSETPLSPKSQSLLDEQS